MKKTTLLYFLNRFLLLFLLSVTFFHTGYGQGKTVTGVVKDSSGVPMPGVQVMVKDTKIAARTAADGKFSIAVPDNQRVLVIRHIGHATQELPATGTDLGNIILIPQSVGLQDVVVIGYGVQRKSDLTGAVSSIKAADITKIGGSNAAEALQGKAPGVLVLNVGAPGNAPIIRVQYLNSHDIASMEILKDASATAIYGSRGANGVILVTTKKGKPGKAVVNTISLKLPVW